MKKNLSILFSLFLLLSIGLYGCGKEENKQTIVPDTQVEENVSEKEETTPPLTEEPSQKPVPEETPEEESPYPYWWELHDYHLDQQDLASDGMFKNLTIQLGNEPDSLNITWFSKSSSRGTVTFTDTETSAQLSAAAVTQAGIAVPGYYRNSATIKGLSSNTHYEYYLKNGEHTSPVYQYETNDLFSTDYTFTIAGDAEIGLGDEDTWGEHHSVWRVVLNRMKSQIPESDFLITMGDQVANPSSSLFYDYFLDNSVLYSTPVIPVVGNHDHGTGFFGDHFSLPNRSSIGEESGRDGDYWFIRGNALFMVLNSMCPLPVETHEQFIAETVAAHPDVKWRIVISHYSPVTVVDRYQGIRNTILYLYPDLGLKYDIDLFIGGHDHVYTRSFFLDDTSDPLDNQTLEYEFHNPEHPLYMIVSGSTTALLRQPDNYPWSALSVQNGVPQLTQVNVTENSLNIVTRDADSWKTVDDFTIYKD